MIGRKLFSGSRIKTNCTYSSSRSCHTFYDALLACVQSTRLSESCGPSKVTSPPRFDYTASLNFGLEVPLSGAMGTSMMRLPHIGAEFVNTAYKYFDTIPSLELINGLISRMPR